MAQEPKPPAPPPPAPHPGFGQPGVVCPRCGFIAAQGEDCGADEGRCPNLQRKEPP